MNTKCATVATKRRWVYEGSKHCIMLRISATFLSLSKKTSTNFLTSYCFSTGTDAPLTSSRKCFTSKRCIPYRLITYRCTIVRGIMVENELNIYIAYISIKFVRDVCFGIYIRKKIGPTWTSDAFWRHKNREEYIEHFHWGDRFRQNSKMT